MNIRKLDDQEVVFLDEEWTEEELKRFRALLKKKQSRKLDGHINVQVTSKVNTNNRQTSAA